MSLHSNLLNPRRKPALATPLTIAALLLLVGGAFALGRASVRQQDAAGDVIVEGVGGSGGEASAMAAAGGDGWTGDDGAAALSGEAAPDEGGVRTLRAEIQGSLGATLIREVGAVGDPLSLVTSRLLVWGLDVARDLRPGDSVELAYELPAGSEPVVHAIRFHSNKLGRVLQAYRFQVPGTRFARYYNEEGAEIELRLKDGPIAEYEQVTSLLKDGRRHKGVDFKAPVGTPVTMPWSGVVKRKNWNYRINGGSLEIEDSKGRSILFLHLAEIPNEIRPGSRVSKGQVVAYSGNTGRSTAPHLHYQVMKGGRVLDPYDLHDTTRVSIPTEHRAAYAASMTELGRLLDGATGGETAVR